MTKFEENSYYICTPPGKNWSDFDGPFGSQEEAVEYMKRFINKDRTHSPEMLSMVVTHFKNNVLEMVKVDDVPLNGEWLYWKLNEEE